MDIEWTVGILHFFSEFYVDGNELRVRQHASPGGAALYCCKHWEHNDAGAQQVPTNTALSLTAL